MPSAIRFASLCAEDDSAPSTPVPAASSSTPPSYRCWVLFDDIDSGNAPCGCCSAMNAMEGDGDVWACYNQERAWLILYEAPDMSVAHPIELCSGDGCSFHPLNSPAIANWTQAMTSGLGWGDLMYEEEMYELSKETPAQKATREATRAAEIIASELALQASKMNHETELVGIRAKMGLKRGEAPRKASIPCKKLYSCCGDKHNGGAKPTTLHVSSECWAWEYTDPRDRKKKTPRVCPWIHPGEDGWHKEWETNRNWKAPTGAAAVPSWRAPAPAPVAPMNKMARPVADLSDDGWHVKLNPSRANNSRRF